MADVIRDLAQIEVPIDLLNQLDMTGILDKFKKTFYQLDDLKRFTTEYEKRNALARWWDNDKLKDAQLSAQEVQAEFSKSIGQLMVISMMQSKRLEEQQTSLSRQQAELKQQSNNISAHTDELEKQNEKLTEQAKGQKKLVEDFLELQELTADDANKLIEIADEVKSTKDDLLQYFDEKILETRKLASELEQKVIGLNDTFLQQTKAVNTNFVEHVSRVDSRCDSIEIELSERHEQFKSNQSGALRHEVAQREALATQIKFVQDDVAKNGQQNEQHFEQLAQSIARTGDDLSNLQTNTEGTVEQLGQRLEQLAQDFQSQEVDGMNRLKKLKITIAVLGFGMVASLGYIYHLVSMLVH